MVFRNKIITSILCVLFTYSYVGCAGVNQPNGYDNELIGAKAKSAETSATIDSESIIEVTTTKATTVTETTTTKATTVTETIITEVTTVTETTVEATFMPEATESIEESSEFIEETITEPIELLDESEIEPIEEEQSYEYSWESDGYYWYFEPSGWILDNKSWYTLVNCVANEAGAYWIDEWDKAKVCEVVFNRLWYWGYPDIYSVISDYGQFSGSSNYVELDDYSYKVTTNVIDACAFYCSWPDIFNHNYFYFLGDGYNNHFN